MRASLIILMGPKSKATCLYNIWKTGRHGRERQNGKGERMSLVLILFEFLDPGIPEAMGLSVTEQISFKLSQLELGFCHLHGKEC